MAPDALAASSCTLRESPSSQLRDGDSDSEPDGGLCGDGRELTVDQPFRRYVEVYRWQARTNHHAANAETERQHRRRVMMPSGGPG